MANSQSVKPTPQKAKTNITTLSLLCWLALTYTWALGHIQPLAQWLSHLPGPTPLGSFGPPSWCLFKLSLHLPCLFCGFTRSFILISQGKLSESWDYHPLGIPVYLLTLTFAIIGLLKPIWGEGLLRFLTQRSSLILISGLLSLGWLWKLLHSPHFW